LPLKMARYYMLLTFIAMHPVFFWHLFV